MTLLPDQKLKSFDPLEPTLLDLEAWNSLPEETKKSIRKLIAWRIEL